MVGDGESAEAHRRFYDEYNAVLDLPASITSTRSRPCSRTSPAERRMFVRDELVRPHAIRDAALLTIEGELDDISGNGQTEAAHALCLNIPRERRAHFSRRRGALRYLFGQALARGGISARARVHFHL